MIFFVDDNPPTEAPDRILSDNDALCVVDMIRAELIENAHCAATGRRLVDSLGIRPNFEILHPYSRTNAIALCEAPPRELSEFADNRANLNAIRSVKGALISSASGISIYLLFCRVANNRPFLPSPGTIRKWSVTFNPGNTFSLYVSRVRNGTILLDCDDGWVTTDVKLIASGIRSEQSRIFVFPNFLFGAPEIIDCAVQRPTFGMIDYLPYPPHTHTHTHKEFHPKRFDSAPRAHRRNLRNPTRKG